VHQTGRKEIQCGPGFGDLFSCGPLDLLTQARWEPYHEHSGSYMGHAMPTCHNLSGGPKYGTHGSHFNIPYHNFFTNFTSCGFAR